MAGSLIRLAAIAERNRRLTFNVEISELQRFHILIVPKKIMDKNTSY